MKKLLALFFGFILLGIIVTSVAGKLVKKTSEQTTVAIAEVMR